MKNLCRKNGVSLVAAIAIILIMSILGLTLALMLGSTSRGIVDYQRSNQAFGLAQAGLNWYMMRLSGIADWSTETNQTGISLGQGTFDIALSNQASTALDFTVTGKVTGSEGVTIQRTMSQAAWKLPSASKFALFWARDTGTLTFNSTTLNGDIWSFGDTVLQSGSSITNGRVYHPVGKTVSVGIPEKAIDPPEPIMPAITTTYYTNLISNYNTLISACTSSATISQNTNLVLTGNTICCRTFQTNTRNNTDVTISGNGIIIANGDILLNSTSGAKRRLTISPSGGNIIFLAGTSLTINAPAGSNAVTGNSGIRFYSQSVSANTQLLGVDNNNTNIDAALFLANRRIIVDNSANITNSTFFLNFPGDATNNYLLITGSGTNVGTVTAPCSLISIARASGTPSALTIDANAGVSGLLYQYDTANAGATRLNSSAITGSIIANQFQGNAISSSTITYNPQALPDAPAEGFDGFATKKPNSWSGI